jgi:flagellar secretion chaperone FliS
MSNNPHDAYLESRILSADPLELVRLLYQAATRAVRDARGHLESGDIKARSRAITKAAEIVIELAGSLDYSSGGDISQRLGQLYEYILGRLMQANVQQADEPLREVLGLLTTLAEGWDGVAQSQQAAAPTPASPWGQPPVGEPPSSGASHAWNF